jgi:hypothetical protein
MYPAGERSMRGLIKLALLIGLLLLPVVAAANPMILQLAGSIMVTTGFLAPLGWVLIVVGTVWGAEQAKAAQEEAERKARQAYNDALKDRTATVISTEMPHRYIYGRARVGSAIVAVPTSGDRDQYKHLICVHAAHECDGVEEYWINGVALGTLDGSGFVTGGDFLNVATNIGAEYQYLIGTSPSFTLPHPPNAGSLIIIDNNDGSNILNYAYTIAGNTVTIDGTFYGITLLIQYEWNSYTPRVRVITHLGSATQTADATLISEVPDKWNSTKRLQGLCYTYLRIDLNQQDFQGGVPAVEVLLRGKKLHDVRSGSYPNDTPAWSQNPALMIADYLTSEMCQVPWTDLPLDDFIAAANVCDESETFGARYQTNGTVTADQSQGQVLERMAQCMAGTICSTTWTVQAGKYVAPVMALDQSDVVGDFSYLPGVSEAELYNGVKGQYISPDNGYVPTDIVPYQNASYVTADGDELWTNIDWLFTDEIQRVHNLCRIFVEDQRNAFTIKASFSYKCWGLKVGQRVTFTSSLLGQSAKVYRIIDKKYGGGQAVELTMKEDAAEIWDFADAVTVEATPNTDLPSPFVVGLCSNIQLSEQLYETTNSAGVKSKAIVTWQQPADITVLNYDLQYKLLLDADWKTLSSLTVARLEIFDLAPGIYNFRVRARNSLNSLGNYTPISTFTIYGLTALPGNVTGFTVKPFNGMALCNWDRTVDLDVKIGGDIEIRLSQDADPSWEKSFIIPDGKFNGDATSVSVPLYTGRYYAKFIDSTGNYSETAAYFDVTEALVTGWTTVHTITESPSFSGTKTGCVVSSSVLRLDTAMNDGTYDFSTDPYDYGTSVARRFIVGMKSVAYNSNDLFDARAGYFDDAEGLFDGSTINGLRAVLHISTSDDDVTYSEYVPFLIADFKCRYAKFRLNITTTDPVNNIDISELSVTAKIAA